jgi:hypothetical protein
VLGVADPLALAPGAHQSLTTVGSARAARAGPG